jgi:hypothetical protein
LVRICEYINLYSEVIVADAFQLELSVINPAGLREADLAMISPDTGLPRGMVTGWVTDDTPPAFDVTVTGGLVEDA